MVHKLVVGEINLLQTYREELFSDDLKFFRAFYPMWLESSSIKKDLGYVQNRIPGLRCQFLLRTFVCSESKDNPYKLIRIVCQKISEE